MNMKAVLAALAGVALVGSALAQDNTPPHVGVKAPTSAKAGKAITATVTVTFAAGLHGYQNPPSKDYLIPVSITLQTPGAKIKSVKYPKGMPEKVGGEDKPVNVYENAISIPVTLLLPKKHGKTKLTFAVHYQQCNDASCFPPADLTATATVNVK